MEALRHKIIKTESQYINYCNELEEILDSGDSGKKTNAAEDEIELFTFLIEKYDQEHNTLADANPIELLKSLMRDHKIKSIKLAQLLEVSTGLISDMLNCKKGMSKEIIPVLSERFKLRQEAFNRPYKLKLEFSQRLKETSSKKLKEIKSIV
jgi:HTH-type transcriptional regulator/antitoxin HigA